MRKFKHVVLMGVFFLITTIVSAQISTRTGGASNVLPNSPTTNTNVGIGTNTPTAKLEVIGDVKSTKLELTSSIPNGTNFTDWIDRNKKCTILNLGTLRDPIDNGRVFRFCDFPQSNLDAKPVVYFGIDDRTNFTRFRFSGEQGGYTNLNILNKRQEELFKIYEDGNDNVYMQLGKPNSRIIIGGYSDYVNSLGHKLFVQGGSAKIEGNILTDASIGIGTSNFTDGTDTYRLSVKGAIRAERVKVYTTWADFVFEKNYNLPTLEEVENHILLKGNLKDIPSAKEVEVNGIELGEMNKLLLQKVEELTLYMIQLNKEFQVLKSNLKKE